MRTICASSWALSVGATAALLAGCGGPSGGAAVPRTAAPPRASRESPLRPRKAAVSGYLYVADHASGDFYLYRYDRKTMTETQIGLSNRYAYAIGACSDRNGNAYLVANGVNAIFEVTAGTMKEIKSLVDDSGYPTSCAINPRNGDLAVTNVGGGAGGYGSVLIYKDASGTPTRYTYAHDYWPFGYDPKGNLWGEGEDGSCSGICILELPYGGRALKPRPYDWTIGAPAATHWDGEYLVFGDAKYNGENETGLDRAILSGGTLVAVSAVVLSDTCDGAQTDVYNWAFVAKRMVAGLPESKATQLLAGNDDCDNRFDTWDYPAGGNPVAEFQNAPDSATGDAYVTKPQ